MFTVAAASLLISLPPPDLRGRAAGAWATGFLIGTVVGPVLGGVLLGWGPRAPFLIYAGLLVITAAGTGRLLRRRDAGRPDPERTAGTPDEVSTGFTRALRHPSFRAAVLSNCVHGWTVYGVRVALVPLFVVDVLRRPDSVAGVALAAFAAGTAATLLLGGRPADERGRKLPILLGSSAVVALTSLWLGFSTSLAGLLAAALLPVSVLGSSIRRSTPRSPT
jgi:predicted MFS family arabinose efflux permease